MKTFMLFDVCYRVDQSVDQYAANLTQPILDLVMHETDAKVGRLTICLPDVVLAPGETILRDCFCELIDDLEDADILKFTGRYARSGFAQYPVVKLVQP